MALAAFIKNFVDACLHERRATDVPPPRPRPDDAVTVPPSPVSAPMIVPPVSPRWPGRPPEPTLSADALFAAAVPPETVTEERPEPEVGRADVAVPEAVVPAAAPPGCPVTGARTPAAGVRDAGSPAPHDPDRDTPAAGPVDLDAALAFIEQFHAEAQAEVSDDLREQRLAAVRAEIGETGTYRHTAAELTFGARVAWRNSARCIGRLYWQSLRVRDRREVHAPAEVAAECAAHLREVTRNGRIRCTITVFAPDTPARSGPRIHNEQLIRYAGYRSPDGSVIGDPRYADFTDSVLARGWRPPSGRPGRFDVLPLLVSDGPEAAGSTSEMYAMPLDSVLEVELRHPEYPWFAELGLRWHAVPAISNMPLEVGGITYAAAPFNGWYMSSEIGARNLSDVDRYDLLPEIADRLWLDTSSERTLWRDRALVELMRAVQWSFDEDGVQMSDHHSESRRFLEHLSREESAGRSCPADWSWIVPPVSGGLTPVFHRYYTEPDPELRPAFLPPGG